MIYVKSLRAATLLLFAPALLALIAYALLALLGTALAPVFGLPVPFIAAVGFIAVFAAASNTPIASTLMGIELFGAGFTVPLVITGFLAYILVGHRGIYGGHRVHTSKSA